jgi:hypothetical protein
VEELNAVAIDTIEKVAKLLARAMSNSRNMSRT